MYHPRTREKLCHSKEMILELRRTSTRAPLLMLRGVLRVDCMVMRLLDAWSAPFAAFAIAKLLGAADALALVLTPADSLHSTLSVII